MAEWIYIRGEGYSGPRMCRLLTVDSLDACAAAKWER